MEAVVEAALSLHLALAEAAEEEVVDHQMMAWAVVEEEVVRMMRASVVEVEEEDPMRMALEVVEVVPPRMAEEGQLVCSAVEGAAHHRELGAEEVAEGYKFGTVQVLALWEVAEVAWIAA